MDSERGAASRDVIDLLFVLGACADSAGCMTCTLYACLSGMSRAIFLGFGVRKTRSVKLAEAEAIKK